MNLKRIEFRQAEDDDEDLSIRTSSLRVPGVDRRTRVFIDGTLQSQWKFEQQVWCQRRSSFLPDSTDDLHNNTKSPDSQQYLDNIHPVAVAIGPHSDAFESYRSTFNQLEGDNEHNDCGIDSDDNTAQFKIVHLRDLLPWRTTNDSLFIFRLFAGYQPLFRQSTW